MDRTEEIKELMIRLVTLMAEEQSQMRREIAGLRDAVEKMAACAPDRYGESGLSAEEAESIPFRFKDLPEDEQEFSAAEETEEVVPSQEQNFLSGPQSEEETVRDTGSGPVPDTGSFPVPDEDDDPEINPGAVFDPDKEPEFVVEPFNPAVSPRKGVLRPRSREEQINDTSEWGMFSNSGYTAGSSLHDVSDAPLLGELFSVPETVSSKEPSWMTDIPGPRVNTVYEALTNNDRFQFIRDLFDDDDEQFSLSMERIDQCRSFGQVVNEMRVAFPEWDESSPLVYQFYMIIRRRFR